MGYVIAFPRMGNYGVPVENLLKNLFPECKILPTPAITKRTLELGSRHSPDFVCVPFKYTLGNYIEALESGANVLIQAGGGCRYRYYSEVQEKILKDLGYEFRFISLLSGDISPGRLYKIGRELGTPLSFARFFYYVLLALGIVKALDSQESYMRENGGFEVAQKSFERLHSEFLERLRNVKSWPELVFLRRRYGDRIRSIELDKPKNCLKVGIIGELYSLMEPFSSCFIEKELVMNKIQVSRYINVSFLLFEKSRKRKKRLREAGDYLKYDIGADGTDSVGKCLTLAKQGYDGIIHLKPFGCMPELNAIPCLRNISRDYKIPVMYFSFDSQTTETGVKTRLEAFCDMISMKRGKIER